MRGGKALVTALLFVAGCVPNQPGGNGDAGASLDGGVADSGVTDPSLDLEPGVDFQFECIKSYTHVDQYFVTNELGNTAESVAVLNSPDGGVLPPGTLIQLIPSEAMYKRGPGWNPATNDWEFLALDVTASGTTITSSGATDTVNFVGLNCFNCHSKAAPKWDLMCESDGSHGCAPLPVDITTIEAFQNADPRCN